MSSEVRELTAEERAWLRDAEERVNAALYEYYFDEEGEGRLDHSEADLEKIQEVFENEQPGMDQVELLLALGAALGQVFVANTAMRWVVVTNEFGTNLCIRDPGSGFILYPNQMISKRVETGREVDVAGLYHALRQVR